MGFAGSTRAGLILCLLCGTVEGAFAWQRPAAKPAEKVEACPDMGEGFVRLPGSATCIRLSGSVRVEAMHGGAGASLFPVGH